jgi:hypothetical protein
MCPRAMERLEEAAAPAAPNVLTDPADMERAFMQMVVATGGQREGAHER